VNLPVYDHPHFYINSFLISWRNYFIGLIISQEWWMQNFMVKLEINPGTSVKSARDTNEWIIITLLQEPLFVEGNLVGVGALHAVRSWERRSAHRISDRQLSGHIRVSVCACSTYTAILNALNRYLRWKTHSYWWDMHLWPAIGGLEMTVFLACVLSRQAQE
jgi:hypothetical protein